MCLLLDGWMNYPYMDETYGCVCGHYFLIYYYVKVGISVSNQQKRCQPMFQRKILWTYLSTLANLTLIILFSEMLNFFFFLNFQIKKYCEGK
jgi:hypothetical protein